MEENTNYTKRKYINGVEYIIISVFKNTAPETLEQKLIRMISADVCVEIIKLNNGLLSGKTLDLY
ncbi:hypothetical protein FACS1894105_02830 [Clostridia bacterium]|nr:hypothetical protein FACS1894105_02830 [Clostridia bacterium]